jgi:hypothetical protein
MLKWASAPTTNGSWRLPRAPHFLAIYVPLTLLGLVLLQDELPRDRRQKVF